MHFFTLLRRSNGKSDRIKTFKSLMKVFGDLFGIRFVPKNYDTVVKYVTLKRGYLCSDCACARCRCPIEMKELEEFCQGAYLCMQLTTFDHQVLFAESVVKM